MGYLHRLKRWLIVTFTNWFVRLTKRTKAEEPKTLNVLNEPIEVFPFSTNSHILAQVTPIGTILWNQSRTEDFSETTKECILRHELSHKKRNPILRGLVYGTTMWCAGGLITVGLSIGLLLEGAPLPAVGVVFALGVLLISVFIAAVRVDETIAEYDAFRYLGEGKFIEAHQELSDVGETGFLTRIWVRLVYPTTDEIITIHRGIQRIQSKFTA